MSLTFYHSSQWSASGDRRKPPHPRPRKILGGTFIAKFPPTLAVYDLITIANPGYYNDCQKIGGFTVRARFLCVCLLSVTRIIWRPQRWAWLEVVSQWVYFSLALEVETVKIARYFAFSRYYGMKWEMTEDHSVCCVFFTQILK